MSTETHDNTNMALLANAIAVALVYSTSAFFVNNVMSDHKTQWYTYLAAFLLSIIVSFLIYLLVYLLFGYLPMSRYGGGIADRVMALIPRPVKHA